MAGMSTAEKFAASLAVQLRHELKALRLNQQDFCTAAGIPSSNFARYVNAERSIPATVIFQMAVALGITASEFVARAEARMAKAESVTLRIERTMSLEGQDLSGEGVEQIYARALKNGAAG